jgi:hypothetical protein
MTPKLYVCSSEGKKLRSDRDAVDLIGGARSAGAGTIAIPVERLDEDFFVLRTRVAGEFVQKFVTYGVRLAILGDVSRYENESKAFRDFVYEANRGRDLWFVASREELDQRLGRVAPWSGLYPTYGLPCTEACSLESIGGWRCSSLSQESSAPFSSACRPPSRPAART